MMTLNHKVIDALRDQIASFPPDCNYGVFVHGVKLPSPAYRFVFLPFKSTVELQWLEHLWTMKNVFKTGSSN